MPILGIIASSRLSAVAVGDYESIATVNGTGSSDTVSFNSIPATFKHLQIRWIGRCDAATADENMQLRVNNDTAGNYSRHFLYGVGSGSPSSGGDANASGVLVGRITGANSTALIMGAGIIDILDYASGTKYPTFRAISGNDQNGSGLSWFASGSWRNTTAITSIQLKQIFGYGNLTTASTFALYGIK
jgi:hypothetical protein